MAGFASVCKEEKILHPFSPLALLNWNLQAYGGFNFRSGMNISAEDYDHWVPPMYCRTSRLFKLFVLSHAPQIFSSYLNTHHAPSAAIQVGMFYSLSAMCWLSWDVSVQQSEKGVLVNKPLSEGTAGIVAGAPPGLIPYCFPLRDLNTMSQELVITQHHTPLHVL